MKNITCLKNALRFIETKIIDACTDRYGRHITIYIVH